MLFSLEAVKAAYTAGEPVPLTWKLVNGTGQSWEVLAGGQGCDAITIRLDIANGRELAEFPLSVQRKASLIEFVELPAGGALAGSFDLALFAQIYGIKLDPEAYVLRASYGPIPYVHQPENPSAPMWPGKTFATPVRVTIWPKR